MFQRRGDDHTARVVHLEHLALYGGSFCPHVGVEGVVGQRRQVVFEDLRDGREFLCEGVPVALDAEDVSDGLARFVPVDHLGGVHVFAVGQHRVNRMNLDVGCVEGRPEPSHVGDWRGGGI